MFEHGPSKIANSFNLEWAATNAAAIPPKIATTGNVEHGPSKIVNSFSLEWAALNAAATPPKIATTGNV